MIVKKIQHNQFESLPPSVAMIGLFDGFHKGHQQLAKKTLELAKEKDVVSAVISFDPDPDTLFKGPSPALSKQEERIHLAEAMGFQYFYLCSFTRDFAAMEIETFHSFLYNLNVLDLICGFDFTYGANGAGTVEDLQQQNLFNVFEIQCYEVDRQKVSSTRIKQLLNTGQVYRAGKLLGYFYSLPGVVETGFQRGSRQLGFPTANLAVEAGYACPRTGVYGGYVLYGDKAYEAMINVGYNPTFENHKLTVEANLFDFSEDIYGQKIRIFFLFRLRDEKKFSSVDGLVEQLKSDRVRVKKRLKTLQKEWELTARLWRIEGYFDIINTI